MYILILLDTGMRASELCGINFSQVDSHNCRVCVMGKGAKERTILFSLRTGQALYLRNSGDPYTLQALPGHPSLDTVKIYLRIAKIDIDFAHRRASPVDNWRLWPAIFLSFIYAKTDLQSVLA